MNWTRAKLAAVLVGMCLAVLPAGLMAQNKREVYQPLAQVDLAKRVEELEKQVARLTHEVELLKGLPSKAGAAEEKKADYEIIPLKYVTAKDVSSVITAVFRGKMGFSITADEKSNSLIVRGTAADVASVRKLIQYLDSTDRVADSPNPVLKNFALKNIKAEQVAKLIQELLADSQIRVAAVGDKSLIVYATPNKLLLIQELILKIDILGEKEKPK